MTHKSWKIHSWKIAQTGVPLTRRSELTSRIARKECYGKLFMECSNIRDSTIN